MSVPGTLDLAEVFVSDCRSLKLHTCMYIHNYVHIDKCPDLIHISGCCFCCTTVLSCIVWKKLCVFRWIRDGSSTLMHMG